MSYGSFSVVIRLMFLVPSAAPQNLTLEARNSKVSWRELVAGNG